MIDLLEELHKRAVDLRYVGMMQSAGDYDYLVAWLRSPEFNNGEHLRPHPAGENTIDEYSNNCPIPFTPSRQMISYCTNNDIAEQLIQSARYIITELLNIYTDDIEQTAINEYLEYSNKIITLLGGEVPEPTPPEPSVEEFGEIMSVFFSTNGVDSPQIDLRYADAPAYDEAGNPVYLEEGWIYESSEKEWHYARMTTNVLTTIYTFPNVSYTMASLRNETAGSAVQIYTSDHVDALGAYLFRAKEPFYFAWLKANGGGDTTSVNAGSSVPLYYKGSMNFMSYSDLSPLKFRAALGKTAEYLDISALEIVQTDTYYAYLKNNGTETVDVYCLIFSD